MRTGLLAVFLLALALATGLALPRLMTWFQTQTTADTVEHTVQHVNLDYTHELSLLDKYTMAVNLESYVFVEAGHTMQESSVKSEVENFLQCAFPSITCSAEPEIQPVLLVVGGQVITGWLYQGVFGGEETGDGFFMEVMLDDTSGAVLSFRLDATSWGLVPVLTDLYDLPPEYWLQQTDLTDLLTRMTKGMKAALSADAPALQVSGVDAYGYSPVVPLEPIEPMYFSQFLLLQDSAGQAIELELWAEEWVLMFNCH